MTATSGPRWKLAFVTCNSLAHTLQGIINVITLMSSRSKIFKNFAKLSNNPLHGEFLSK